MPIGCLIMAEWACHVRCWHRKNMIMIKVASYNIRKAIGTDRRRSPDRIIEVLGEIGADIVALQEADRRFGKRTAVLTDLMLEHHTPYRAVPLGVRAESMGWHGNALLIRRDFKLIGHDLIHLPCLEPRGAVTATLQAGDKTVRVVGMHLDLSGLWRRRQAAHPDPLSRPAPTPPRRCNHPDGRSQRVEGVARGCLTDFARHYRWPHVGAAIMPPGPLQRSTASSGADRSPSPKVASITRLGPGVRPTICRSKKV